MAKDLTEKEIWTAANQMVQRHGDAASFEAALNAGEFLEDGDFGGHRTWMRILNAIMNLQSTDDGEMLN